MGFLRCLSLLSSVHFVLNGRNSDSEEFEELEVLCADCSSPHELKMPKQGNFARLLKTIIWPTPNTVSSVVIGRVTSWTSSDFPEGTWMSTVRGAFL